MDERASLRVTAKLKNLAQIRRFVQETGRQMGADPDMLDDVIHAVDEAATNVMEHGYSGGEGQLEIQIGQEGQAMIVRIRDQASPFDPTFVAPPDLTLPLHQRPIGGLGIYLIREFVDSLEYEYVQGGNQLTLVKKAILPRISREGSHGNHG